MEWIIQIIVWLLIAGFLYWAFKLLIGIAPIDDWFKNIINVLLLILVAAIILFYVIIPLLQKLAHISISMPSIH